MPNILFTGGGSAGHVLPNLAVASRLPPDLVPLYMGTGGYEKALIPQSIPFFTVESPKLSRSLSPKNLLLPIGLYRAVQKAKTVLRREKIDLVFSKGGYAALPACFAAFLLKIPVIVHESDLTVGLANRLCLPFCAEFLTAFEDTAKQQKNGRCVGAPLFLNCKKPQKTDGFYPFLDKNKPILLVFGGGSGSKKINEAIEACKDSLLKMYNILHIVGKNNPVPAPRTGYFAKAFEENMQNAYAAASFVLCRGGANTLFEVISQKKPALVVPLATNTRGDQAENAAYFYSRGLCHTLDEKSLSPKMLEKALFLLKNDRNLAKNLQNATVLDASEKIASIIQARCTGKP